MFSIRPMVAIFQNSVPELLALALKCLPSSFILYYEGIILSKSVEICRVMRVVSGSTWQAYAHILVESEPGCPTMGLVPAHVSSLGPSIELYFNQSHASRYLIIRSGVEYSAKGAWPGLEYDSGLGVIWNRVYSVVGVAWSRVR